MVRMIAGTIENAVRVHNILNHTRGRRQKKKTAKNKQRNENVVAKNVKQSKRKEIRKFLVQSLFVVESNIVGKIVTSQWSQASSFSQSCILLSSSSCFLCVWPCFRDFFGKEALMKTQSLAFDFLFVQYLVLFRHNLPCSPSLRLVFFSSVNLPIPQPSHLHVWPGFRDFFGTETFISAEILAIVVAQVIVRDNTAQLWKKKKQAKEREKERREIGEEDEGEERGRIDQH